MRTKSQYKSKALPTAKPCFYTLIIVVVVLFVLAIVLVVFILAIVLVVFILAVVLLFVLTVLLVIHLYHHLV